MAFTEYNRQVEGWFKGELLKICHDMESSGEVINFFPDRKTAPTLNKKNADLYFELPKGLRVWIELKHWHIRRQPGHAGWPLRSYFTQSTSGTISNALSKFPLPWNDPAYFLIVISPRPDEDEWRKNLRILKEKFSGRLIRPLTSPKNSPQSHFIGLLRL